MGKREKKQWRRRGKRRKIEQQKHRTPQEYMTIYGYFSLRIIKRCKNKKRVFLWLLKKEETVKEKAVLRIKRQATTGGRKGWSG